MRMGWRPIGRAPPETPRAASSLFTKRSASTTISARCATTMRAGAMRRSRRRSMTASSARPAFGYDDDAMSRALALRRTLDWDKVPLDVEAAVRMLRPLRVGAVGYCVGGSVAWLAACRLPIEAAACYYASDIARQ